MKKIHKKLERLFLGRYDEWCMISYIYVKDIEEAKEVVQDVCVKILLRNQSKEILDLDAYIAVAIRNKSLKKIKHDKKFEILSETNISTSPASDAGMIQKQGELHLQKALASLKEPSKKIFELCVIEGHKYDHAANSLGISKNTVKYHIKKVYKLLRTEMQDVYYTF